MEVEASASDDSSSGNDIGRVKYNFTIIFSFFVRYRVGQQGHSFWQHVSF